MPSPTASSQQSAGQHLRLGEKYKALIELFAQQSIVDPEWVARTIRKANTDPTMEATLYREMFRGIVLNNFYAFVLSIGTPVDRNPGYRDYIDRMDKENIPIGKLDRKITAIRERIELYDELDLQNRTGASLTESSKKLLASVNRQDELAKMEELIQERNRLRRQRPLFTLCMIPRGLFKTTVFQSYRAAWYYLRDTVQKHIDPIEMMLHSDLTKAGDNLDLVKQVLQLDFIAYAFADVLQTTRNRRERLSFNLPNADILRKEDNFMIGSVGQDFGGIHAAWFFLDDIVVEDNSDTPEKSKRITKWFSRLQFLDDHSGDIRFEMTGTHYFTDSVYTWLQSRREGIDVVTWVQGAYDDITIDDQGHTKRVYNFKEVYDEAYTERQRANVLPYQFQSQVLMIPQEYQADVDIVAGIDYKVTPDELPATLDYMKQHGLVITVKDPSYSVLNKKEGDARSRDVTITGVYYDDVFYVFDEEQLLGGRTKTIYEPLKRQVFEHLPDIILSDSQGTQMNYTQDFIDLLADDLEAASGGITPTIYDLYKEDGYVFIPYTKPQNNDTKGKAERASKVLSELFRMGRIKVVTTCPRMIKELERETKGFDFLDTLIMAHSIDLRGYFTMMVDRKHERRIELQRLIARSKGGYTNAGFRSKGSPGSGVISRTTGY